MVLVHDVVAVHHVASLHVAEAEEDPNLVVEVQRNHVPAGVVDGAVGVRDAWP